MKINLSFLLLAGVLALTLFSISGRAESLLWSLDLSGQPAGPAPEFGPGLEIREENGEKILAKVETGTQFFPINVPSGPETKAWTDIIFRVRFREQERFGTILVVRRGGEREGENYLWYYIGIRGDGIEVACHRLENSSVPEEDPRRKAVVRFADIGEASLGLGEWITAEAAVGDEIIRVSVDNGDGGARKAQFAVFPGTGSVQILALAPVDIASATVHQSETPITATP